MFGEVTDFQSLRGAKFISSPVTRYVSQGLIEMGRQGTHNAQSGGQGNGSVRFGPLVLFDKTKRNCFGTTEFDLLLRPAPPQP